MLGFFNTTPLFRLEFQGEKNIRIHSSFDMQKHESALKEVINSVSGVDHAHVFKYVIYIDVPELFNKEGVALQLIKKLSAFTKIHNIKTEA